jgi:transaldolase
MNDRNRALHDLGQSLWVDNITRSMLDEGTLERYIADYSVTGLTSNPTIFDKAVSGGDDYDSQIDELSATGAEPARRDSHAHRPRRRFRFARGLAASR